mmetsp:Transcript_5615/g.8523  ORF Transcript_5615/g.8523 Transcript_5615/m.8523 type:complete len:714 (-) Transcript_5615:635-2776(-)
MNNNIRERKNAMNSQSPRQGHSLPRTTEDDKLKRSSRARSGGQRKTYFMVPLLTMMLVVLIFAGLEFFPRPTTSTSSLTQSQSQHEMAQTTRSKKKILGKPASDIDSNANNANANGNAKIGLSQHEKKVLRKPASADINSSNANANANGKTIRKLSENVDFHSNYDKIHCLVQNKDKSEICRPDILGEFLEEGAAALIHAPLKSIPLKRRIPGSLANNDTYIQEQRDISPSNGTATALVEYNPSLVALYENTEKGIVPALETELLDYITGRYIDDFLDEEADRVMYIRTQRSTNHHACGVNMRKIHKTIAEQCFVAISLLDKDLQAIPDAELVVNMDWYIINRHVRFDHQRYRSDYGAYNCQINDVALIAQRSTKTNSKKDQLFLLFSGESQSQMIPIDLRRTLHSADNGDGWNTKIKNAPLPASDLANEKALYGEGLQMRFLDNLIRSGKGGKVKTINKVLHQEAFLDWRKNYHILEATDGSTWFEISPLRDHETRPINFFHHKFETSADLNYFPNSTIYVASKRSGVKRRTYEGQTTHSWYRSEPRYSSLSLKNEDIQRGGIKFRGTACCADINFNGEQVKVGLTHTVTKERAYLHAFYAFQPFPPFKIVALSGYFCLGGMKSEDIGYDDHWMSQRVIDVESELAQMIVKGETYNCPKVTFASGINEMIDSRSNIIISYGVGDCYSRSIVVSKKKIEILLSGKMDKMSTQK